MPYTVKELFLIEFSIGFFFHMGSLFTMTWVFGFGFHIFPLFAGKVVYGRLFHISFGSRFFPS